MRRGDRFLCSPAKRRAEARTGRAAGARTAARAALATTGRAATETVGRGAKRSAQTQRSEGSGSVAKYSLQRTGVAAERLADSRRAVRVESILTNRGAKGAEGRRSPDRGRGSRRPPPACPASITSGRPLHLSHFADCRVAPASSPTTLQVASHIPSSRPDPPLAHRPQSVTALRANIWLWSPRKAPWVSSLHLGCGRRALLPSVSMEPCAAFR